MRWFTTSLCLALGFVLGGTPAGAQTPPATAKPQSTPESTEARHDRIVKAMPAPAATLAYGTDPAQRGELRLPDGKGPFPVAVLIHGGCWANDFGGLHNFAGLGEMLRKRGVASWSITYRRTGDKGGGWPGTFDDVAAGVDYLGTLAKAYPLDLGRTTVVGHSAGAHLALWTASRSKLAPPYSAKAGLTPRSVVAIDGPGALAPLIGLDAQVCGRPVIVPFMGGTPAEKPDAYRIASPADHLPLGVPQLLVLGSLGPFMQSYAAAARASGDTVKTLAPPGADHFDIITPTLPNGEAVADWIAFNAFGVPAAPPAMPR